MNFRVRVQNLGFRAPERTVLNQAWNWFVLSCAVGILFNLLHPSGIELKRKPLFDFQAGESAAAASAQRAAVESVPGTKAAPIGEAGIRISLIGAKQRYDQGTALFLDARSAKEYSTGHIPGALNFHADEFDAFAPMVLPKLRQDQELIAYCTGTSCELSNHLAQRLKELGYLNVKVFFGGWPEWKKAGYPVREGETP